MHSESESTNDAIRPAGPIIPLKPFPVSGLYTWSNLIVLTPAPLPSGADTAEAAAIPFFPFKKEELRLDVDGRYPQMTVSGVATVGLAGRVNWVATLAPVSGGWAGSIWFKDGTAVSSFPYTNVKVTVQRPFFFVAPTSATVTFSGGGSAPFSRVFGYVSRYFHKINVEFDNASNATVNLDVHTGAHPNKPPSLPAETLALQEVFRRTGFDVTTSSGNSIVPIAGAGSNALWSNQEMHDAMQTHWLQVSANPKWAMWVFYASLSESGNGLGGIMFDDQSLTPPHRQGTAIFNDSFIKTAPTGDANPAAWVDRMNFWTACHEMGHSFNLAHSWQKALVYQGGGPWIPLSNDPQARSFMNYPYNVSGGQSAFFANFEYRFSDQELLFLRHAPERFVRMGDAAWFDHHGFEQALPPETAGLQFEIGIDKPAALYDFLEPVVIEMRLRNSSDEPMLVPENALRNSEHVTAIIKRDGQPAREFAPYARFCWQSKKTVLQPGEELKDSLFLSAGLAGWLIAEPGSYTIQLALDEDGGQLVSNPLRLRVAAAAAREEERLAQDYFTNDVGRVLAFDGSKELRGATDTLQELIAKLPQHSAAIHAAVPLALTFGRDTQQLRYDADGDPRIVRSKADVALASRCIAPILDDPTRAIATLGAIDYDYYAAKLDTQRLARSLTPAMAERLQVRSTDAQAEPPYATPAPRRTAATAPKRKRT